MSVVLAAALALLPQASPWREDVATLRAEALKAGKPCVLFININAPAS